MTSYSTTASYSGQVEPILDAAISTLTHNGFAIVERSKLRVTLTGPGLNSSRQNPILGASRIVLDASSDMLRVDAELGGVDTLRRFLMRFPFLLGLGLAFCFALIGGFGFGRQFGVGFGVPWAPGWQWLVVAIAGGLLPVAPWLVISPLMARMIRHRTQRALDVLVQNATFSAQRT